MNKSLSTEHQHLWVDMVREGTVKKNSASEGEGSGVGSSRQRVGPTYNREYKRAQHVPQRAPGDDRDPGMTHHILKPRHPRSLPR